MQWSKGKHKDPEPARVRLRLRPTGIWNRQRSGCSPLCQTEPTPLSPSLMGMSNCVGLRCPGRRALALQLHLSDDRTNHVKQLKACKTCHVKLWRLLRMRWNAAKIHKISSSFPLQHCKSALLGRVVAAHAGLPQGSGLKPPKQP